MTRRHGRPRLVGRHVSPRRRAGRLPMALSVGFVLALGLGLLATATFLRHPARKIPAAASGAAADLASATPSADATPSASSAPSPSTVAVGRVVLPSDGRRSVPVRKINAGGSPKSLAVAPGGDVAVMSMSTHEVVVYGRDGKLRARVSDAVVPASLGRAEWTSRLKGGPVEGVFSPDGKHLWVSNYAMSGPGFTHPGSDGCSSDRGLDRSFVYRIDTSRWAIDAVVPVGAVPKDLRFTPDGKSLLVTTWCGGGLTTIDPASAEVTATVALGSHPRGIVVSPDSSTAYVALTGSADVAVVDLTTPGAVRRFTGIGEGPRQVLLSKDGRALFVTCLTAGTVVKLDTATGMVVRRVSTGKEPRTAVLSADGSALFVVNYESGTVTRLRSSDLSVLETLRVPRHTIALAYVPAAAQLWIGQVDGTIGVFGDQAPG